MSAPFLGKRVRVIGTSRSELNGQEGVAVSFVEEKMRYNVRFPDGKTLALQPKNIESLGPASGGAGGGGGFFGGMPGMGGMGGAGGAFGNLQAMLPQAMQALQAAQAEAAKVLPAWLPAHRAAQGLMLLLAVLVWKVGMVQAMLIFAAIGGVLALGWRDYVAAGAGLRGIPSLLSGASVQVSQRISARVGRRVPASVGGVLLLAMFALGVVVRFGVLGGGAGAAAGEVDVEWAAYQKGYSDGKSGLAFGTSMPTSASEQAGGGGGSVGGGFFANLGFGKMITLFLLGQSVYSLGGQPWSAANVVPNFKMLPSGRKLMLGFIAMRLLGVSPI